MNIQNYKTRLTLTLSRCNVILTVIKFGSSGMIFLILTLNKAIFFPFFIFAWLTVL